MTTDTLLGVDFAHKQKDLEAVFERNNILRQQGKTRESICYLREMAGQYPNQGRLCYELSASLYSYCFQGGLTHDEQEIHMLAKEMIKMCEKALTYSADARITNLCRSLLAYTYIKIGEYNKAKEIADVLPSIPFGWLESYFISMFPAYCLSVLEARQ